MLTMGIAPLVLLGFGAAPGETPRPAPRPAPTLSILAGGRDMEVGVYVRAALARDERLAQAGIRVNVREGVAVLTGPIASEALAQHAVWVVGQVRGVLKVKSELFVVPPPPAPLYVRSQPEPTRTTAAAPPSEQPAQNVLANRSIGMSEPVVALKMPVPELPNDPSYGLRVSRSLQTEGETMLLGALDKLRHQNRRYRTIRTDVSGNVVVVRGGASGETLMAFIEDVRQLEGVQRVVLNQNPTAGR